MSIPKIEIKTPHYGITEIYVDGHRLNGVRSFEMRQEVGEPWPTLTVDLNALDLTVDGMAIMKQKNLGKLKIEFEAMLNGNRASEDTPSD